MTTRAKLTVYSALATALAALCLTPLLTTKGWLTHAFLVVAAVAAVGAGLRRTPFYRWTVPAGQLLALFVLLLIGFASSAAVFGGLVPGPESVRLLGRVLGQGLHDVRDYAIPAPPSAGLRLILVGAVGLIAVVVDAVAVTYRRSALAGLPLLALYSVGNGLAGDQGNWLWFAAAAAGYLVLLFAEGQDRISRWGRIFRGADRGEGGGGVGALGQNGRQIGVLALALALLLPAFLPRWGDGLLHAGSGTSAGGRGPGAVSSLDPLITLTGAIPRPRNIELFSYRSDNPDADSIYLRTGSLDAFDGTSWKRGSVATVPFTGTFPAPEGLGSVDLAAGQLKTDVRIGPQLDDAWLPMPYPAVGATLRDNSAWQLDPVTSSLLPAREKAIKGLSYSVTALDVRPTATSLRTAPPAPDRIRDQYLTVPRDLPPMVRDTALRITARAKTGYDKAVALRDWFTGPDFTYDATTRTDSGSDAMKDFLERRRGFCVHFASTMAVMARILGVPARVALGFTPGNTKGNNVYSVTDAMYHAWPELYFEGYGWLRFEPTPTRGVQPDYSDPVSAPATRPTSQPTVQPQASAPVQLPSAHPDCDAKLRRTGDCGDRPESAGGAAEESWLLSGKVLTGLVTAALLLALLLTPMVWRTLLRRRRLGAGGRRRPGGPGPVRLTDAQVLAAWDELIDSAWDLGIPPDDSRTPRATARRIAETAELDETATAAAGRVALATERVLYARSAEVDEPLAADVRTARNGLRAHAGRRGRVRAVLLPASSAQLRWRISEALLTARLAVGGVVSRAVGTVTGPVRRLAARRRDRPRKGGGAES
ncbi:transglutaminaseTgpA domain-containing protein [Kitasatospora misakiensis]|uniref:TransglutaminaseTgpA domain-containing protein n=1 Tax=Kitasatospora misakiensis TaxID=67330 RepID=A0ABW0WWV1_9ACTN